MLGRRPFIDRHLASGELVEVFSEPLHLSTDYYLRQPPKNIARRESKIVVNWLTEDGASGIQISSSWDARETYGIAIAQAVVDVFQARFQQQP